MFESNSCQDSLPDSGPGKREDTHAILVGSVPRPVSLYAPPYTATLDLS